MNIDQIESIMQRDGIIFISYGGFLNQSIIANMAEAIEKESAENELSMGLSNNILTVFIELSQNMMHHTEARGMESMGRSSALIVVGKNRDESYFIESQNHIFAQDKAVIEPILAKVVTLSREEIKQEYRRLRKEGVLAEGAGAGIGFYEIAKRCDSLEYAFVPENEGRFTFRFKALIKGK